MALEAINGLAAPLLPLQNNNPPCANLLNRFQRSTCSGKTIVTIGCVGFLAASGLIYYGITSLVDNRVSAPAGALIIGVGALFIIGCACMCALSVCQN